MFTYWQVPLKKRFLFELEGEYDQIWMMHSLEHIPDPQKEMDDLAKHLAQNGLGIIIIPVCDSEDFKIYKSDWAGCDAPVHLFLHTRKSLDIILKKAGLEIDRELCLESEWPLLLSEKVKNGYPIDDHSKTLEEILGIDKMKQLKNYQVQLNESLSSGMVTFVVKKSNGFYS